MSSFLDFLEAKKAEKADAKLDGIERMTSDEIAADIERFLARGGKIKHIEAGVMVGAKKLNELENIERMKACAHRIVDSTGRKKGIAYVHSEMTFRARNEKTI